MDACRVFLTRVFNWSPPVLFMLAFLLLVPPSAISAITTDQAASAAAASAVNSSGVVASASRSNGCAVCHGESTVNTHHQTPYFLNGECTFCHTGITIGQDCSACHTTLEGLENPHHSPLPPSYPPSTDCSDCHSGVGNLDDCLGCHLGKIRTPHHSYGSAQNLDCTTCHTTLIPITACQSCHMEDNRERHHVMAQIEGTDCAACHPGSTDIVNGCTLCHDFSADNVHHSSRVTPYGLPCTSCHIIYFDPKVGGPVFEPPSITKCITCHETVVGTTAISTQHHLTAPALAGDCISCHAGLQPDVDCEACHTTVNGETIIDRHHNLPIAQLGECTFCHSGAEAVGIICVSCHSTGVFPGEPDHHGQPQAITGDCRYCHADIQIVSGSCSICHTLPVAEFHHDQPLQDLNGDCGACHDAVSDPSVCANCHTSNPHHSTSFSQTGDCAHCHFVPADQTDTPKQAACRECHGQYMHDKGGPIQNFGACKACHLTDPYHAKPIRSPGYTGIPARAGKGKFNLFWALWGGEEGPSENISPNGEDMNDEGGRKWRYPTINFGMAIIEHEGQVFKVPSFDLPNGMTNALQVCTNCHGDFKNLVACDNLKWREHLTLQRVDVATYQLAEATYIGNLCSGTGSAPPEICNDGIDNDNDFLIDCNDSDCSAHSSCQPPPAETCTDSIDNDLDGFTDCSDSDCAAHSSCQPPPAEICTDSIDNDLDGFTDCSDSDCAGHAACQPPADIVNLALNKSTRASGDEGSNYSAPKAVDGNTGTYWWKDSSRDHWLRVDLGQRTTISKVIILWGGEYAEEYNVEVSNDASSWTRMMEERSGNGGTDTATFSSKEARYIRIYCRQDHRNGYQIKELEVYK